MNPPPNVFVILGEYFHWSGFLGNPIGSQIPRCGSDKNSIDEFLSFGDTLSERPLNILSFVFAQLSLQAI